MSGLKRIAPVFAVSDLRASLAHYARLGFATREYAGGGYGFATRDGVEIHIGTVPAGDARAVPSTAYIWVDDADEIAAAWRAEGADVRMPEDTDWGQHEGVVIDPDGNIIRFGSPIHGPHTA
jgi:predicted enzyme related to lactoylglutathione lyase